MDPLLQVHDLLLAQRLVRWHLKIGILIAYCANYQALIRLSGNQGGSALTTYEQRFTSIEKEPSLGFFAGLRVAIIASLGQ